MLEVAGVGAAVPTHSRTCQPAFQFFPQRPAYPQVPGVGGGSSPRGTVRLEALSLRAGPDGLDGSS